MDNWLPLKRLHGLVEKIVVWLSKNQEKKLIQTGSLKRFLKFSISHQKKRKKSNFSFCIQYSECGILIISSWNREGQSHTRMRVVRAWQYSHRNHLYFRKSFRKRAVTEFCYHLSSWVCYVLCSTVPSSWEPPEPVETGGALLVLSFPWQCG